MNVTQAFNRGDFVSIDTRDILFICAGTFSDLHEYGGTVDSRPMGFGAQESAKVRRRISTKQLVDYGMLAEFLGRLPVVVQLDLLGEPELLRVLTEPPDSIVREYHELLGMDGIELKFAEGALREVVRFSVEKGLGARGLRSILEFVMADVMFEAPEHRSNHVTVDAGFVRTRLAGLEAGVELGAGA
jgi:ATP-dependent Clp protease ATP-binding subunit ClpX